jgi:hypothetical protein
MEPDGGQLDTMKEKNKVDKKGEEQKKTDNDEIKTDRNEADPKEADVKENPIIVVEVDEEDVKRGTSHRNSVKSLSRARMTKADAKLERVRLLLQHLVSPDKADVVYRNSFFLMLHYFSTPPVIFDLLLLHLKKPPSAYHYYGGGGMGGDGSNGIDSTKLQRYKLKELAVLQVSMPSYHFLSVIYT